MKLKSAGIFLFIFLVIFMFSVIDFRAPALPPKVTSTNILKITPGMSLEQVFGILGAPLRVKALHGQHTNGCKMIHPGLNKAVSNETDIRKLVADFIKAQKPCCEGNKEDLEQLNQITLVYTEAGAFISYPMLWVHLDTSLRVNNVYAKEYEGGIFGDDPCIYSCSHARDTTYRAYSDTGTDVQINKEKFYRVFK